MPQNPKPELLAERPNGQIVRIVGYGWHTPDGQVIPEVIGDLGHEEAAKGLDEFDYEWSRTCIACLGAGSDPRGTCLNCDGTGLADNREDWKRRACTYCWGTGIYQGDRCHVCYGTGLWK